MSPDVIAAATAASLSAAAVFTPLAMSLPTPLGARAIGAEAAQDALGTLESGENTVFDPDEGRLVIDILTPPDPTPRQKLAFEACAAQQDAARLRNEIIVCRQLEDASAVSGFDQEKWERDYAQRTQGVKTPNVEGAGGSILMPGEGSLATITVTMKGCYIGPCAPEQALIIDVEALPEAPPGSDADRIARGLAPLEKE